MSAETLAIAILLPPGVAVPVWLFYRPSWQHMAGGLLLAYVLIAVAGLLSFFMPGVELAEIGGGPSARKPLTETGRTMMAALIAAGALVLAWSAGRKLK
jgi:hypothetical protein